MRRWWALCLLVAVAMAVHCDERVELAQRADENRLLAAALADVSRCQTLRCTVRVERRVDGIERRVAAQRKERALLHCDVEKKTSAGEPTTAPSPPLVKEGCVSAKEVELRQKESAVLADLLKQSTACKSLDCIIEVEAKIKRVKKQSRGARHDRNLECASTQPGIAVVGTEKKVGGGGTRRVCAIHAEGICLDMAKELTHEEAQRSCDALTDRYDVRRESFREGEMCKRVGAIGLCVHAAAMHEQGTIVFFAPMTVSRARQHCEDAHGMFQASTQKNWAADFRREANEVAWGELESYKAFASLLAKSVGMQGGAEGANATSGGVGAGAGGARSAAQGPPGTPGNGSQTLRILGAVFLFVFIILFSIAAALMYWKSSVESSHKRRRVGEGYVRITTTAEEDEEEELESN